jgi:ribosomal protein S25
MRLLFVVVQAGSQLRMNLLWIRPVEAEQALHPDERRVRDYVDSASGVSESAASLADKLGISPTRCRRILEGLVEQGVLNRRDFADIESIYTRFPSLA